MPQNPFVQKKRAEGCPLDFEKTASARIAIFRYDNICHIGVTMSTYIFLYGSFYPITFAKIFWKWPYGPAMLGRA
jgi:hypothetical protein